MKTRGKGRFAVFGKGYCGTGTKQTGFQSTHYPYNGPKLTERDRNDSSLWCTPGFSALNNTVMLALSAALAHVLTGRKITLHLISPGMNDVSTMTVSAWRTHLKALAVRARSGTEQVAECRIING